MIVLLSLSVQNPNDQPTNRLCKTPGANTQNPTARKEIRKRHYPTGNKKKKGRKESVNPVHLPHKPPNPPKSRHILLPHTQPTLRTRTPLPPALALTPLNPTAQAIQTRARRVHAMLCDFAQGERRGVLGFLADAACEEGVCFFGGGEFFLAGEGEEGGWSLVV